MAANAGLTGAAPLGQCGCAANSFATRQTNHDPFELNSDAPIPQSLSAVHIHLVFSTKGRRPFLRDKVLRDRLHSELGGISKRLECPPTLAGGMEDHIHLLARLGRTISQADWVQELKRVSSIWLKEQDAGCAGFEWQSGYAAFSVSQSNVEKVRAYIANQEEHHRPMNFQDELRGLLLRHEIEWGERFLWD